MNDQPITCPNCSTQIPLTEALSKQIKEQILKDYEEKMKEDKQKLQSYYRDKYTQEMKKLQIEEQKKAKEKIETEMQDLIIQNKEKEEKLNEAREKELLWRKQMRELEEQKKQLDLEVQRKIDDEKKKIQLNFEEDNKRKLLEIEEQNRSKFQEKEKQIQIMQKTIEDLKRQSEQGSMQIQGDVQEQELKNILSLNFPSDQINDVPTGIKGADLVQTINSNFGQKCGVILWESKNTKSWSNDWVKKLKSDQILANADVCILVTRSLPDDIENFGMIDGVLVTLNRYALCLTTLIRNQLIEMSKIKRSVVNKDEKMQILYEYLCGSQFKTKVENIIIAFRTLKDDLETEKRSIQRLWNKREIEIERVLTNTTSMYGDLQGLVGNALPNISLLDFPQDSIESPN